MKTVLVLIAGSVLCTACRGSSAPETKPSSDTPPAATDAAQPDRRVVRIGPEMLRDLRITTAQVDIRMGAEEASLLGELRVNEDAYAEVGTPIAARVVRLLASNGDRVGAGQGLAELQSPELGQARAGYLSAEARARLAEGTLQRRRDLASERIVPAREVQEAEAEASSARAELRAAAASLAALGAAIPTGDASESGSSLFVLRSPVSGTVIDRAAARGQMVDPEHAVFRVADLTTLWLTVHAFERDAVRVVVNAPARIAFPALPGQEFNGRVALVGREVDAASRTIPIRIDIRNPGVLRPGMAATAWIPIGDRTTPLITVPVASLQRVENDWCVFIPSDRAGFEIRKVGRGRDLGRQVEVLSGLRAGDTVVVDGSFLLKAEADKARGGGHEGHER